MTTQTPRSIKLIQKLERMAKSEKSWQRFFRKRRKRY